MIFERILARKASPTPAAPGCPMGYDRSATDASTVPEQLRRMPPPSLFTPAFTDPDQASDFIRQFHAEVPGAGDPVRRVEEVLDEIARTGTYRHTAEELAFGAKVAWRNSARCIGRLYWRSLVVRDLREVSAADDLAEECFEHLRLATNGGRIRPMITIFAPDRPGRPAPGSPTPSWCATPATRTTTAAGPATRRAANSPPARPSWAGSRPRAGSTCCPC